MRVWLSAVLCGAMLSGCGTDRGDLEEARERWKKHGYEHYELMAEECSWGECSGEVHVVVDESGVTAEHTDPPGLDDTRLTASNFTVEGFFHHVELAIDRGDLATVNYDLELGYVWAFSLDGDSGSASIAYDLKEL